MYQGGDVTRHNGPGSTFIYRETIEDGTVILKPIGPGILSVTETCCTKHEWFPVFLLALTRSVSWMANTVIGKVKEGVATVEATGRFGSRNKTSKKMPIAESGRLCSSGELPLHLPAINTSFITSALTEVLWDSYLQS